MSTSGELAARQRRLRVVHLALVASLVGVPALHVAGAMTQLAAPSMVASFGWLASTVLVTVFVVIARGIAARLGQPPASSTGQVVALTLIPCVSIVGIPYVLHQLARSFAALIHDDGLVQRTTIAAVLYPVIAYGGGFLGAALMAATFARVDGAAASSTALMMLMVSLPSLASQAALAAATYFVTAAARAAIDLRADIASVGAGGSTAVSV